MKRLLILLLVSASCLLTAQEKLKIYLFASSTCEKCRYLKELILPDILETYPEVSYEHIPVDDTENFKLQLLYEKHYTAGVQASGFRQFGNENAAVKAFVGKTSLAGVKQIEAKLEDTVQRELASGNKTITPDEIKELYQMQDVAGASKLVADKYDSFTWNAVAWAGLLDGINPCAFVTLVFFISVLANLRKSKKDIIVVGTLFSVAVFGTYLLLGIGALKFIKIISVQSGITKGINICMAGFCLLIGLISLLDVIRFHRNKKAGDFSLKLPKGIRKVINRQINTNMRKSHLWFWALFLGITVSLLESLCTGQVYLPTIAIMVKRGSVEAFGLLAFYNLMFIVPLLAVFGLAFAGVSSKQVTDFFNRHLFLSKVLMMGLFFFLGIYLLFILN